MGSLYKQKMSRIWWVKYYVNGLPIRESTGTDKEGERRFLKAREGPVAADHPILPRVDCIRYNEVDPRAPPPLASPGAMARRQKDA